MSVPGGATGHNRAEMADDTAANQASAIEEISASLEEMYE